MRIAQREKEILQKVEEKIARGPYEASWASLCEAQMPQWLAKEKLGIFIHWVFTVFRQIPMSGIRATCTKKECRHMSITEKHMDCRRTSGIRILFRCFGLNIFARRSGWNCFRRQEPVMCFR